MPAAVMEDDLSRPEEKFHLDTRLSKDPSPSPPPILARPHDFMRPHSPHHETTEPRVRAHRLPVSSHPPTTPRSGSSPVLKHRLTSAATTPSEALPDRPEKRMRLESRDEHDEAESRTRRTAPPAYDNEWFRQLRPSAFTDHDIRGNSCSNCHGTDDLLGSIVQSLIDLQSELSRLMPSELSQKAAEIHPRAVTTHGLKHSLHWSVQELRTSIRALQGALAMTRSGLPSLADIVPREETGHSLAPMLVTPKHEKQHLNVGEPGHPDDLHHNRTEHHSKDHTKHQHHQHHQHKHHHHSQDHPHALSEPPPPPMLPPDESRRHQSQEHTSLSSVNSPRVSSGSSALVPPGYSPRHSQYPQYRPLPSPTSQYSALPLSGPVQFSSSPSSAVQASHLQDLQHQISTKTLALQTLQKEHDQLLAAFSRSQIRCNTLDKKSQVSDHEINILTEEKIRLQQQVESLEAQVEELQKSREDVHKQSSADGAQWRQIMAMSSQLQMKSAEEARRFKMEREGWESEKTSLKRRIQDLEVGRQTTSAAGVPESGTSEAGSAGKGAIGSMSGEDLRQEVLRLRARSAELELILRELSPETELLDRAIGAIYSIKQKLAHGNSLNPKQHDAG